MAYIGAGTKKDKHGNRLVLDGKQGNTTEVIILDNVKAGNYKYNLLLTLVSLYII